MQFAPRNALRMHAFYASEVASLMHTVQSLFIIIIIHDALFIDSLKRAYEPTVCCLWGDLISICSITLKFSKFNIDPLAFLIDLRGNQITGTIEALKGIYHGTSVKQNSTARRDKPFELTWKILLCHLKIPLVIGYSLGP